MAALESAHCLSRAPAAQPGAEWHTLAFLKDPVDTKLKISEAETHGFYPCLVSENENLRLAAAFPNPAVCGETLMECFLVF